MRARRLDADKKSVAVEVTLQPMEKTLTDAEIEALSDKSSPRPHAATERRSGARRARRAN